MSGYNLALAIHVIAIVAMFSGVAIVLVSMGGSRRAMSTQAAREWAKTASVVAWLLPVFAVIAFIPGAYMASDRDYFKQGWVQTAMTALLLMLIGFVGLALRLRPLARAAAEAPDGPLPVELRRRALDPIAWSIAQTVSTVGTGVIVLMTFKPDNGASLAVFGVSVLVGLLSAAPAFVRRRRLSA